MGLVIAWPGTPCECTRAVIDGSPGDGACSVSPSVVALAEAYAGGAWRADLAMLDTLASVEVAEDVEAIRAVLQVVYRPWLEAGAECLQEVVRAAIGTYVATPAPSAEDGTCFLFTDGLRFDVAQRAKDLLEERGLECTLTSGLAALPSITATAKPAVSPASALMTGDAKAGLEPMLAQSGARVTIEVLRRALSSLGVQVLKGDELGNPTGCAWTELGNIDSYGHEHGWRVAHHLDAELRAIVRRVGNLLEHGWRHVKIVTDHGWLLMPGGLPKSNLPEHLTEVRKGRCARLKEESKTDQQTVPWHWDSSVRFAVAPGIHCYEAGKEYEHGGLSPQECIVPKLVVKGAHLPGEPTVIAAVTWRRLRCNVIVSGASGLRVDIRTRPGDPATSLAQGGKTIEAEGPTVLLVGDEDREGEGAVIVVVAVDGSVKAQMATLIGGED